MVHRSETILDSLNWKTKKSTKSFFIRLKPRDSYFGLAVHEGDGDAESDGDPILSVRDHEDPIQTPVLYGFALMTRDQLNTKKNSFAVTNSTQ